MLGIKYCELDINNSFSFQKESSLDLEKCCYCYQGMFSYNFISQKISENEKIPFALFSENLLFNINFYIL